MPAFSVVVPVASITKVVALMPLAVMAPAEAMFRVPRRVVSPTRPLKVTLPESATKVRFLAPSSEPLKVTSPSVEPLVFRVTLAPKTTASAKLRLAPAPAGPPILPAPPVAVRLPSRVMLPEEPEFRLITPASPPVVEQPVIAALPEAVRVLAVTVEFEEISVILPAFLPFPLVAPPELVILPATSAPLVVMSTTPPAVSLVPVVFRVVPEESKLATTAVVPARKDLARMFAFTSTAFAETMFTTPSALVLPTTPLKVMSPVPAVRLRLLVKAVVPSTVLPKVMLPLVEPEVLMVMSVLSRMTGPVKETSRPKPSRPLPAPAPPAVTMPPVSVVLPVPLVRLMVPPSPPALLAVELSPPRALSRPTRRVVPASSVMLPAFRPWAATVPSVVTLPVTIAPLVVMLTSPLRAVSV